MKYGGPAPPCSGRGLETTEIPDERHAAVGNTIEITLPCFGDGDTAAQDAVVSFWPVNIGDEVREGDDLLEIVTDKASFIVPSPCTGRLLEQRVREDDRIRPGDVIAVLETDA